MSVGTAHYLFGFLIAVGAIRYLAIAWATARLLPNPTTLAVIVLALGLAGLNLALGFALNRLHVWAAIVDTIVLSIMLAIFAPAFLLTTVYGKVESSPVLCIYGAIVVFATVGLGRLLSGRSAMVFSPIYRNLIAATPQIKPRVIDRLTALLAILVLLVAAVIVSSLLRSDGA